MLTKVSRGKIWNSLQSETFFFSIFFDCRLSIFKLKQPKIPFLTEIVCQLSSIFFLRLVSRHLFLPLFLPVTSTVLPVTYPILPVTPLSLIIVTNSPPFFISSHRSLVFLHESSPVILFWLTYSHHHRLISVNESLFRKQKHKRVTKLTFHLIITLLIPFPDEANWQTLDRVFRETNNFISKFKNLIK